MLYLMMFRCSTFCNTFGFKKFVKDFKSVIQLSKVCAEVELSHSIQLLG